MTDQYNLAEQVVHLAKSKDIVVATAESCTGGMISAAITDVPGSSSMFDRGFVTYSYASKTKMLGVTNSMLAEHGAVSEAVAQQMATGALQASNANITISVTGVAGPGASGAKAEGLVWLALASKKGVAARKMEFGALGRHNVRLASVETALNWLISEIEAF